ncbi:MAG: hypothetical protein IK123_05980, partial [Lachnospiraceae bacterium]|nr:hypothetical protein [Lachnospiraceae bacterium]
KVSLLNTITHAYDGEYLTEATRGLDIKPNSDMTIKVEAEVEDVEVLFSYANEVSSHTRSVYAEVTYDGFTIDATGYMDQKQVLASCPIVGDYLFTYDYSNDKHSGMIVDVLDDQDIEISEFNEMLAFLNDNSGDVQKFREQSVAYFTERIASLDFKKTGNKETFTVNGEKVECKEYATVLETDTLEEWINGYQDLVEEFVDAHSDALDTYDAVYGNETDFDELFDEILDEIDELEDLNISIFTKGKITAAVRVVYDDDMYYEVQLKGGDYLAQNVEVISVEDDDEETVLSIEGKTKGDVQTTTIEMEEYDMTFEYSFNRKTGEFEMSMEVYGREIYACEATLTVDKNSYSLEFDELTVDGDKLDIDKLVITISTKAEIVKPKGEEFDLGDADEDDFEDLVEDIKDEIEDNDDLQDLIDELDLGYLMYMLY